MRLICTGRALHRTAPSWAALSIRKCRRCYAVGTATQSQTKVGEFNAHSFGLRSSPCQVRETNATPDDEVPTPWQRRLLELNKPKQIVSEGNKRGLLLNGNAYELDAEANLSSGILMHLDRRLYLAEDHPLGIIRSLIESVFPPPVFHNYTHINPVVTTTLNFDTLGFPADHPGRSKTDTYYVNKDHVLRTHTSAHEDESFRKIGKADRTGEDKHEGFTLVADVYRRDSVDRSHYPVFHQMEGARTWLNDDKDSKTRIDTIKKDLEALGRADIEVEDVETFSKTNPMQEGTHNVEEVELVTQHLKRSLEHVVVKVINAARQARTEGGSVADEEPIKARWIEAYFPFTAPSFELEVWWKGEWLELLGCGVTQQNILNTAGVSNRIGWAWGIGIERLAMLLFGIPDIRLFWSEDPRFLSQFKQGTITEFKPFSKHPTCFKDVAFWIAGATSTPNESRQPTPSVEEVNQGAGAAAPAGGHPSPPMNDPPPPSSESFHENDLMEIVRDIAGTLVEDVKLVDDFTHPKTGRRSLCYRINYRSLERTLTNEETNDLHAKVVARLGELDVELR